MEPIQELLEPDDEAAGSSSLRSLILKRLNSAQTRRSPETYKLLEWLEEKHQIIQTVYDSRDQLTEFTASSEQAVDSLTQAYEAAMSEAKKTIAGLQREVTQLKENSSQGTDIGMRMLLTKEVERVKAERQHGEGRLKAEVKRLQEELYYSQNHCKALDDEVASLSQKLETDETLLREMSGGLADKGQDVKRLEAEVDRLKKVIDALKKTDQAGFGEALLQKEHHEASHVSIASKAVEARTPSPTEAPVPPCFEVQTLQKQVAQKDKTIETIVHLGAEREAELTEELTRQRTAYDTLLSLMDTRETEFIAKIEDLTSRLVKQPVECLGLVEDLKETIAVLADDKEHTAKHLETVREQWSKCRKEELGMLKQEIYVLKTTLEIRNGELDKLTYDQPSEASSTLESCKQILEDVVSLREALKSRAAELEVEFKGLDKEYRDELRTFTEIIEGLVDELSCTKKELMAYKSQGQEAQLIMLTSQLRACQSELDHLRRLQDEDSGVRYLQQQEFHALELRTMQELVDSKTDAEVKLSHKLTYLHTAFINSLRLCTQQPCLSSLDSPDKQAKTLSPPASPSLLLSSKNPVYKALESQEVEMLKGKNAKLQGVIMELRAMFKQDRQLMSQDIDRLRGQLVNVDKRIGEFVRKIEGEYRRAKDFSTEIAAACSKCTGEAQSILHGLQDTSGNLSSLHSTYKASCSQVCSKLAQESQEVTKMLTLLSSNLEAELTAYKESVYSNMPQARMEDYLESLSTLSHELDETKTTIRELKEMHRQEVAGVKADFAYQFKVIIAKTREVAEDLSLNAQSSVSLDVYKLLERTARAQPRAKDFQRQMEQLSEAVKGVIQHRNAESERLLEFSRRLSSLS
jgi:chromosome segregation ATPase